MIWKLIYGPRPRNPAIILWYLFGNWEDGPYGWMEHGPDPDWRTAAKWWLRNPTHNVFFHLCPFALRMRWSITLIGTPENPEAAFWPRTTGVVVALTPAPMFSFRTRSWEGYFGWRPMLAYPLKGDAPQLGKGYMIGAFGMALRKGGYK